MDAYEREKSRRANAIEMASVTGAKVACEAIYMAILGGK